MGLRLAADDDATPVPDPGARAHSIAVFPFTPSPGDPQNASFGIGLADSIVNHLSGLPALTVRPLSAVMKVTAGESDPQKAGRLLGVDTILVGTFAQRKDRFEVGVKLVDTAGGEVITNRTIESRMDDLVEMERMVVSDTLRLLAPRQDVTEQATPPDRRAPDSTAHYLYLLALGKLAMFQGASVPDAVELLEQSIKIDPEYAPAHAALAVACSAMWYLEMSSDYSWNERAIASARRAIYLDERSASAHHALANALLGAGEPVEAARETLLALKLDPNHPRALRTLATLLTGAGLPEQVKRLRAQIAAIDPEMDLEWLDIYVGFKDGKPQKTIAGFEAEVARRLAADEPIGSQVMRLGYMSFMTGNSADALRWAATMESVSPSKQFADMIRMLALARTGDAAAVRSILERIRAAYLDDWEACAWIGMALTLVHEDEEAIAWIQRSADLGSYDLELLDNARDLDPLRTDPRFSASLSLVRGRAREIVQLAAFAGYR